ncbi:hypothetical protein A2U01_0111214, partial [Trifolium medium]|nr:hypothetical protein [Trifolium medium]
VNSINGKTSSQLPRSSTTQALNKSSKD